MVTIFTCLLAPCVAENLLGSDLAEEVLCAYHELRRLFRRARIARYLFYLPGLNWFRRPY